MTTSLESRTRLMTLPARTFRPRRYRPGNLGTWSGHLPFAADLVAALKPSLLVELGTHHGESYFGMCQAVQENAVACRCYAVDTWKGDSHSGYYDESVFEEVSRYNEDNYASFSKLLRTTFDAAQEQFGDETIELLHIDGMHTYEAVRHDFYRWLPKVRPGGVVLLHDTLVRHLDFGVWRLWEELDKQLPSFEFTHSWGLGVLRKPGSPATDSSLLEALFTGSPGERDFLRHYYASQAEVVERHAGGPAHEAGRIAFRVFPSLADGYSEGTSAVCVLNLGEWQRVTLELPQGSPGRIRIDPAEQPCAIELAGIVLKRSLDKTPVCAWTSSDADAFLPVADLVRLPGTDRIRFLSTGRDPQLLLPELDGSIADQPLVLEAQVRIDEDLGPAVALLGSSGEWAGAGEPAPARAEYDKVRSERDAALVRTEQLSAEIRHQQAERLAMLADYRRVHADNETLQNEIAALRGRFSADEERWRQQDAALKAELRVLYQSRSWRLTAPLRALFRAIR